MASNFPIQLVRAYPAHRVKYFPVKNAETFITGALVFLTGGEASECGADPANILGIAMAPASIGLASAGSIYGGKNIPVFVLSPEDEVFIASATTPVFATHIGNSYGVEKTTNWRLDTTEVGATRLVVTSVHNTPQQEGFVAKFLAANLQLDAIAS